MGDMASGYCNQTLVLFPQILTILAINRVISSMMIDSDFSYKLMPPVTISPCLCRCTGFTDFYCDVLIFVFCRFGFGLISNEDPSVKRRRARYHLPLAWPSISINTLQKLFQPSIIFWVKNEFDGLSLEYFFHRRFWCNPWQLSGQVFSHDIEILVVYSRFWYLF